MDGVTVDPQRVERTRVHQVDIGIHFSALSCCVSG
jgi:hypothetical protein